MKVLVLKLTHQDGSVVWFQKIHYKNDWSAVADTTENIDAAKVFIEREDHDVSEYKWLWSVNNEETYPNNYSVRSHIKNTIMDKI